MKLRIIEKFLISAIIVGLLAMCVGYVLLGCQGASYTESWSSTPQVVESTGEGEKSSTNVPITESDQKKNHCPAWVDKDGVIHIITPDGFEIKLAPEQIGSAK